MEGLWNIISGWTPVGQTLFLLLVLWIALFSVERLARYLTICLRGWPSDDETALRSKGDFQVGFGTHEIEISTPRTPTQIWVGFGDTGNMQVCQSELDTVSVMPTLDGFIIHLEIRSSRRHVRWQADL
jgi:hypothetical protein